MIPTLFAIALLVVAGGILAFLAFHSQAKDSLNDIGREDGEPFAVLAVAQAFDPDYAIIWDTQVPALQLVDNAGIKGTPTQQLHPFYVCFARRYPELYDGCTFKNWLEFLEREELITRSGTRVFITVGGHQFLEYRVVPETVLAA